MTWGAIAVLVKQRFPDSEISLERNLSIARALVRKWGQDEAGRLIEGAAIRGWQDLRALQAADGVGLRWARETYWRKQNTRAKWKAPESLKQIFKDMSA